MFPTSRAALLPLWATAGLPLAFVCVSTEAPAHAQATVPASTVAAGSQPDPADAKARVPAALYVSPLRAYQGFAEVQLAPWRESNERVGLRGDGRGDGRGHDGHEKK